MGLYVRHFVDSESTYRQLPGKVTCMDSNHVWYTGHSIVDGKWSLSLALDVGTANFNSAVSLIPWRTIWPNWVSCNKKLALAAGHYVEGIEPYPFSSI